MLLTVLFLILGTNAGAATYSHIVAFGDSLSDHNGLSSYNTTIIANGGQTAPNSWTNNEAVPYGGDVWLDYLKTQWGATLENKAIGGAMTSGHENSGIQALIDASVLPDLGFTGQVANYLASSPTFSADETVFTIWIGGNDCLEFFRGEYYTTNATVLITDSVVRIITQMGSLYAEGARNFLVLNLPDLAKTPAFNTQNATTKANVTAVVNNFNAALASSLSGFASANPAANVYTIDTFTYLNKTISDRVFGDSATPYLKVDENCNWDFLNFNGTFDRFLFFDCIHPTTKAHEMIAAEVADTLSVSDNNDNGGCFINTVSVNSVSAKHIVLMSSVLLIIGFAGIILKKDE